MGYARAERGRASAGVALWEGSWERMAAGVVGPRVAPRVTGSEGTACRLPGLQQNTGVAGGGGEVARAPGRASTPGHPLCVTRRRRRLPSSGYLASPPGALCWGTFFGGLVILLDCRWASARGETPRDPGPGARRVWVHGTGRSKSGVSVGRESRLEETGTAGPVSLSFALSLFQAQLLCTDWTLPCRDVCFLKMATGNPTCAPAN